VPEFGSSLLLPRLMGHARAAQALLLGEPIGAAQAVAVGLASAALPASELLAHARRMARRFNALPPGAVRDSKRLLRAATRHAVDRAIQEEGVLFTARLRSPEAREALQAFLQKRTPDFTRVP
jgi:enoyl-CoA hydratase/carnithine racemase